MGAITAKQPVDLSAVTRFGNQETISQQMSQLHERVKEIEDLQSAIWLAKWDMEAHMATGSSDARADELATLSNITHKKRTHPSLLQLTENLTQKPTLQKLSRIDQAIVKEVQAASKQASKLSPEFEKKYSSLVGKAHKAWVAARKNNNFKQFAPYLEQIVAMNQQKAEMLGYQEHPYDALLEEFESGLTVKKLDAIFGKLKQELIPLLKAVQNAQVETDPMSLRWKHNAERAYGFVKEILEKMGYDFTHGRLDLAAHPSNKPVAIPFDVRVMTRIEQDNLFQSIMSITHEGGHALYHQGISPKLYKTGLGHPASKVIHESQARIWENHVSRSKPFWHHFFPKLKALFPKQLEKIDLDEFYRNSNAIQSSLIRTDADELTYHFHIMLRYELEKALVEGKLKVKDLPKAWNQKVEDYLGIKPDSDTNGVLQDIHWSWGWLGYFPTYSLGSLQAAQFYKSAQKALPNLEKDFAKGKFLPFKQWLNKEIHAVGKLESADEISRRVTGETLNPKYFIDYLWDRYGKMYSLTRQETSGQAVNENFQKDRHLLDMEKINATRFGWR